MDNHVAAMLMALLLCSQPIMHFSQAKVYTKCGLTEELIKLNVSRSWVGNWVCLVESESFKDTGKVINKANGSKGLGLFQINSREWCQFKSAGGKCQMKCEDLTNEDIRDDVTCARKAIEELGFQGWNGWVRSCKGRESVTRMPICPGL
ncbi:PREDICTED: lysozyme-like [Nicrophorus vespilloides]|uniref:lysozyme n=1 Tax=Nicrophorus vespilloides TaxID=110193 RepID=A0A142J8E2_NICVS|nr:PREDICTED: lysozyme-like [Nicrophorus vespilloides]AMR73381.1 lysozyme 4 [Nicrophorus vespilloides]